MSRPRLLDLFCCAGGAAVGYHRAGFDVVGVDINPQPNYPFEFHQADALQYVADHGHEYDAIHASPPCQGYSTATADHSRHPRLIAVVRILLQYFDVPYVIENVEGARKQMHHPTKLCGSGFGLRVRRHRYFESNMFLAGRSLCKVGHAGQGQPVGVYGDHPDSREFLRPDGTRRGNKARTLAEGQQAMGIDWMTWKELTESIPPAYADHWNAAAAWDMWFAEEEANIRKDERAKVEAELVAARKIIAGAALETYTPAGAEIITSKLIELQQEAAAARVDELRQAASDWQEGEWANTPTRPELPAQRLASAQYVVTWLRARADEIAERAS